MDSPCLVSVFRPPIFCIGLICLLSGAAFSQQQNDSYETSFKEAGRGIEFTIKNTYSSPITAFVATANPSGDALARGDTSDAAHFVRIIKYYDALARFNGDHLIVAGGLLTTLWGYNKDVDPTYSIPRIRAIIYEDGRTSGEDAWVQTLLARRRATYEGLLSVHDFIDANSNSTTEQLLSNLKARRSSKARGMFFPDQFAAVSDLQWFAAEQWLTAIAGRAREISLGKLLNGYKTNLERSLDGLRGSKPNFDAASPPKDLPLEIKTSPPRRLRRYRQI